MESNEDIISRLHKEIKDKDADIQMAGLFGKQLLDDIEHLKAKLKNTEDRNEDLEQSKYSMQLDLETLTKTIESQAIELESYHTKADELAKRVENIQKENSELHKKIQFFKKEKSDSERVQEDLQLENKSLKSKIDILDEQIKRLQQSMVMSFNETKNTSVFDNAEMEACMEENKKLLDALTDVEFQLESAKLQEARLLMSIKQSEEDITEKCKDVSEYRMKNEKLKEDNVELQAQIEILKIETRDVNQKGNSVFGELDDRRKYVEKEYNLLAKKYENVMKNYDENQNELIRCKGQMAILLSMKSRNYQETYIKKLENSLAESESKAQDLTEKMNKMMRNSRSQVQEETSKKANNYDYLRILHKQAENRVKELENELFTNRMSSVANDSKFMETERILYRTQEDLDTLSRENSKLQQQIAELTLKPDGNYKSINKVNIEILPRFKNNLSKNASDVSADSSAENLSQSVNTALKDWNGRSLNDTSSCAHEEKNETVCKSAIGNENFVFDNKLSHRERRNKEGKCAQQ